MVNLSQRRLNSAQLGVLFLVVKSVRAAKLVHFPSGSLKQRLEVMMLRQRLKERREKFLTL